jgi:hypothetical protein
MRDDDEALRALARAGERLAQIIGVERGEPEEERQRSALGGVCGPWFSGMEPSTFFTTSDQLDPLVPAR